MRSTQRISLWQPSTRSWQSLSIPTSCSTSLNGVAGYAPCSRILCERKSGALDICRRVPDVYLELTGAIARSETSSAEIAAIIAKDPATSAKLLQLVNSACFGALRTNIGKLVLAVRIPGDYKKVQQASNKTLRPPARDRTGDFRIQPRRSGRVSARALGITVSDR